MNGIFPRPKNEHIKACLNGVGYEKAVCGGGSAWSQPRDQSSGAVHRTWTRLRGKKWDINRLVLTLHCSKYRLQWVEVLL